MVIIWICKDCIHAKFLNKAIVGAQHWWLIRFLHMSINVEVIDLSEMYSRAYI
jgi:hypothetical protein